MAPPEIVLPKWMGRIGAKLPGKPPCFTLMSALNTMLKKGLLPADMEFSAGRKFEIEILDADITAHFSADNQKFTDDNFNGMPDLRLAINSIDSIRVIMHEEDPNILLFSHKLQIEDDIELSLITRNLLDNIDWPSGGWFPNKGASS